MLVLLELAGLFFKTNKKVLVSGDLCDSEVELVEEVRGYERILPTLTFLN